MNITILDFTTSKVYIFQNLISTEIEEILHEIEDSYDIVLKEKDIQWMLSKHLNLQIL